MNSTFAEWRELRRLYLVSFALRFGAGFVGWLLTYFELFEGRFLEDALSYESQAADVANDWLAGRSSEWLSQAMDSGWNAWGSVVVIAAFYFITGGVRILPLLIAFYCSLTSWTPVLTYRIGRQLGAPPQAALAGGWLAAVSPAFAFWSGALYKEGLILLVLSLAIYHTLLLQETGRWQSLLIVVLCLPALYALRFYLAILTSGVLLLGMLMGRSKQADVAGWSVVRQIVVTVVFVAALLSVGFTEKIEKVMPESLESGLERVQNSRKDLASYSSGYHADVDVSTPEEALRFLPVGLTYFLAAPFFWQFGSFRQNLALPETLAWVLMYPLMFLGLRQVWRRHPQGAILLVLLSAAICCFYAIFAGNIGTVYRMRIQVWLLWAPLIGWGWHAWRARPLPRPVHGP